MNMPGFSAEQSLKQHQGRYSQRSTGRSVELAGDVRPQARPICDHVWDLCFDGNVGACWYWIWNCAGG
jgi:hypothetical protein